MSPRRILLLGGLGVALLGMTYGLWYAMFAEHQALDGIGASLTASFISVAHHHHAQSAEALQGYRLARYNYDRQVDAHSHWLGLSMLLIVLGIGIDYVYLSRKQKLFLAWGLLIGSVLFPLSVLLQTVSAGPGPKSSRGPGLRARDSFTCSGDHWCLTQDHRRVSFNTR